MVVILTLIDMVGMGNGSRGRRRRVFRLLPVAFKFISAHSSSATKSVHSTRDICNFFLLSSHFQSSFCFYIRPTFLSPLRCIALFMYFSSSVVSSLFNSIVSFFLQFFFFLVLPTVEGPHSDTLSRTRFSVFLRILFGVSSSSSSISEVAILAQGRLMPAPWRKSVRPPVIGRRRPRAPVSSGASAGGRWEEGDEQ